jgi:hypothetical protein
MAPRGALDQLGQALSQIIHAFADINSNSTSIPTQHQSQLIINSNSTSIPTQHQFQLNK